MSKKFFSNYKALSDYMHSKVLDGTSIVATLFLNDTISLMKELLTYDDVEIGSIDVAQEEYSGYLKEYYIILTRDMILDITPAHNGNIYLEVDPDMMLIHGDASSSIIKTMRNDKWSEIYIGSEDNELAREFPLSETETMLDENDSKTETPGTSIYIDSIFKTIY